MAKRNLKDAVDDLTADRFVPTETAGALVPCTGRAGTLVPAVGTDLRQCPTSLDLTTPRGKALAMAAGNPGDVQMDAHGSAHILATDYLIYPEEREDPETGEVSTFARTVLFDEHGQTFRTTSAHAPHRLHAALQLYSAAEWRAGIPFVIRERRNKAGTRTYHDIRVQWHGGDNAA